MHRLYQEGLFDSDEADALRDEMDAPWHKLSEDEKKLIQGLAVDLNWVKETIQNEPQKSLNPMSAKKLHDAITAKSNGEWGGALQLFRRWRAYAPADAISWTLGMIWSELGYNSAAALFLEHAAKLSPEDKLYPILLLNLLLNADDRGFESVAKQVVSDLSKMDPEMLVFAISILAIYIGKSSAPIVSHDFLRDTLQQRIHEMQGAVRTTALVIVSNCYNSQGNKLLAYDTITKAINNEPYNDILWALRGSLHDDGKDFSNLRAVSDYEKSISLKTPHIRPYYYVVAHYLDDNDVAKAFRFAEVGAKKLPQSPIPNDPTNKMASKLLELVAIINSAEGRESVSLFQRAIAFDPNNTTALKNLQIAQIQQTQNTASQASLNSPNAISYSDRITFNATEYNDISSGHFERFSYKAKNPSIPLASLSN